MPPTTETLATPLGKGRNSRYCMPHQYQPQHAPVPKTLAQPPPQQFKRACGGVARSGGALR